VRKEEVCVMDREVNVGVGAMTLVQSTNGALVVRVDQ